MANKFIEYIIEDPEKIILGLDQEEKRKRKLARDMVDDLASFGMKTLRINVPTFSSYLLRHLDKTLPTFKAGGAGGGGEYEVIIGVKAGTSRHPLYVEGGTGIYGPIGWYLTPVSSSALSWFSTVYGRPISKKFTKGQRPQRYFYNTWKELQIYSKSHEFISQLNIFR